MTNNWEVCPLCSGEGFSGDFKLNEPKEVCSVCKGTKVIHSVFGTPPQVGRGDEFFRLRDEMRELNRTNPYRSITDFWEGECDTKDITKKLKKDKQWEQKK